jgi:ribosomal protein S18 acetylase RimI-like enzyme
VDESREQRARITRVAARSARSDAILGRRNLGACEDRLVDPLANPLWHALTGRQSAAAERVGLAVRYEPAVAPFAALPDAPTREAWDDLAALVGGRGVALLFGPAMSAPPGWTELFSGSGVQMVAREDDDDGTPEAGLTSLTPTHVPAMLDLVERTRPGPFAARTIELGTYLGVFEGNALVAMAGERMRLPEHTEISAVCTDAAVRGRGLATSLVRSLARRIRHRDERPLLHVAADNVGAIRLYEALGFQTVRTLRFVGLRAPDAP